MNKKLVLKGVELLELEEGNIPPTPSKGAIIKVLYAGICHSDLHMYKSDGGLQNFPCPRVLGHEISGVVHKLGNDNKDDLKPGDKVLAFPWAGCLECDACKAGVNENCNAKVSPKSEVFGVWNEGGFQEFLLVENTCRLIKICDNINMANACLVPCSGVTAYNAVQHCRSAIENGIKIKGFANVMFNGAGALCLWAIEIIKVIYGNKIKLCVADITEEKLGDAKEKGADSTLCLPKDGEMTEIVPMIKAKFDGRGIDAAADFVNIHSTQARIFASLEHGATQVCVGIYGSTLAPLNVMGHLGRQIRLQGCYAGTQDQANKVLEMMGKKQVTGPPVSLVKLEDIDATFKSMLSGNVYRGRYVVQVSQ